MTVTKTSDEISTTVTKTTVKIMIMTAKNTMVCMATTEELNGIKGTIPCILSNRVLLDSKVRHMAERRPKEKAEAPKSRLLRRKRHRQ